MAMVEVQFKVPGTAPFAIELESGTAVRDVKIAAEEACGIAPEHMRMILKDRVLKDSEALEATEEDLVQIMFTAGHTGLVGGSQVEKVQRNPFQLPVRGLPGSKGSRVSRLSGRTGGMGLIRKYGILMKRQEFREKATEIGFVKYR